MIRGRAALLAVAVIAWFVALAAWIDGDPRFAETAYDAFSSFNSSPGGTSQAFGYLAATHRGARRLIRDVAVEHPPRDATIFRIGSRGIARWIALQQEEEQKKSDKKAKDAKKKKKDKKDEPPPKRVESLIDEREEAWIRSGGHLVIAPAADVAQIHLQPGTCGKLRQVFPVDPPLPAVDVPNCHSLSGAGLQRFHSLLTDDSGPTLVRRRIGAGEILVFSIPEALSNEYLAKGGNLAMLERLAGSGRRIYFDETVHGIRQEASIWDLLVGEWRLGPALAVLALAAMAAFWRKARATGLPERVEADARSDAVDLVQSLGQLYDRSVDREESLRLYYHALVRAIHARTGLTGEALERLVRVRTEGYDPKPKFQDISREEFQRMLKILNHAYETVGYAITR
jgi:uncharacterized protein DUF4350